MKTLHFNPFFPVNSISNVFEQILQHNGDLNGGYQQGYNMPPVNFKEGDDHFVIEMAVPGFEKSDIDIQMENEHLVISADIKSENEEKEGKWVRKEFNTHKFSRKFTLSKTADTEKINAEYKNGVLTLTIAKREEARVKPARLIQIQ